MASPKAETNPLDIGAILDRALESVPPRVRPLTKTQQLREQRSKIVALRAKGYTLGEIASMVSVSKDTLRQAIREPDTIPNSMPSQNGEHRTGRTTGLTTNKQIAVKPKSSAARRKQKFPANDDL